MDEIGIWAQIVFPGVVGLGGQDLGELVKDVALRTICLEIFNDANAEIQAESGNRLLPMALLPAWDIDACVREVAARARTSACAASTSPPTRRTSARPTSRAARGIRCGRRAARSEMPVHFHIGASLTTMNFFGTYPWDVARRRHQARDRRRAAVHRERARRRQHHLLGHARPLSPSSRSSRSRAARAGSRSSSKRSTTRWTRTRRGLKARAVAAAVGVLQAQHLRHDVVRAHRPRERSSPRSARTTSCSRPTSRTRRACTPTR